MNSIPQIDEFSHAVDSDPMLPAEATAHVPHTGHRIIIEPGQIEKQYWRDLWRYRELMFFLAWRDVSVHYKQTVVGIVWALIRPLSMVLAFTLVFSRIARLPSDGIPYIVLVLSGMLAWQLFAACLGEVSNSLVANSNLITKVYFPRLIVPLATVAVSFVDFLVTFPVLIGFMLVNEIWPTWRMLFLPLFLILLVAAAIGPGLCLAALNVRFRDIRYVVPFVVQFGLYLSPVGFSSTIVPERFRDLYMLNPMAGIIDGVRWSLFASAPPFEEATFWISLAFVAALLVTGIWFFRKTEKTFADVI